MYSPGLCYKGKKRNTSSEQDANRGKRVFIIPCACPTAECGICGANRSGVRTYCEYSRARARSHREDLVSCLFLLLHEYGGGGRVLPLACPINKLRARTFLLVYAMRSCSGAYAAREHGRRFFTQMDHETWRETVANVAKFTSSLTPVSQ